MLKISNLSLDIENKAILKGLNLNIGFGEIHSIMGPNGSGKSTLFRIIAGHPDCKNVKGEILYRRSSGEDFKNILDLDPAERARLGIFMSFQHPIEVPGVMNLPFLREAFNSICRSLGVEDMKEKDFLKFAGKKAGELGLPPSLLERSLNEGLSGGEKKKNELLQMMILSPTLSLLDEMDSGLDIDSIKMISQGVKKMKNSDKSFIIITHYQRLLSDLRPDHVHVLVDGQIKKTGGAALAKEIDKKGYDQWM